MVVFPEFDGDPVFSNLLGGDEEKGFLDVLLDGQNETSSSYVRNTAILETIVRDSKGNAIRITDFAPRYARFERIYHPGQIIRRIEPIEGLPRITIRLRPTRDYGEPRVIQAIGSNHLRYPGGSHDVRLTTDAPLSYILHETRFALTRPLTLIIGSDESLEASVDTVARESLERTRDYWISWVRGLAVPLDYQQEVIRAAVSLKLCNYRRDRGHRCRAVDVDPGGAGHAAQLGLPLLLAEGCVLRRQGAEPARSDTDDGSRTSTTSRRWQRTRTACCGPSTASCTTTTWRSGSRRICRAFSTMGPVRVGNQAAEQLQHDAYGSIILAVSQMFIDQRLPRMGDEPLFRRLELLGHRARRFYLEPDAGIWEYRGRQQVHTHSATMCWVALDRLWRIAAQLGLNDRVAYWRAEADKVRKEILTRAWNPKRGAIVGALDQTELDASVLLLPELGLLPARTSASSKRAR